MVKPYIDFTNENILMAGFETYQEKLKKLEHKYESLISNAMNKEQMQKMLNNRCWNRIAFIANQNADS